MTSSSSEQFKPVCNRSVSSARYFIKVGNWKTTLMQTLESRLSEIYEDILEKTV